jgi:hypothetical protein
MVGVLVDGKLGIKSAGGWLGFTAQNDWIRGMAVLAARMLNC